MGQERSPGKEKRGSSQAGDLLHRIDDVHEPGSIREIFGKTDGRVFIVCWIWWEDECFEDPPKTEFGDEPHNLT